MLVEVYIGMCGLVDGVPRGRFVRFMEDARTRDWMFLRMQVLWASRWTMFMRSFLEMKKLNSWSGFFSDRIWSLSLRAYLIVVSTYFSRGTYSTGTLDIRIARDAHKLSLDSPKLLEVSWKLKVRRQGRFMQTIHRDAIPRTVRRTWF